ncbi:MAG: PIG-L family deacetylase [Actinomycetota bacterium]|nr:PIG-L family deacetylase [Actinomycetota bacterium]
MTTPPNATESMLVISAHAADFVWRAGGAMALYASRGHRVTLVCLSYGERGESARYWREGMDLEQVKAARHAETEQAAGVLGADLRVFDVGDYPLGEGADVLERLIDVYREVLPTVVLTHTAVDPWNTDHVQAHHLATKARIIAQAPGYDPGAQVLGAPPVFLFEPHQSEYCEFMPDVLLDITEVWDAKLAAMRCMEGQEHLWDYYTDVAKRRGVQAQRNSGPNLGLKSHTLGEAYQRVFPQVATELS